MEDRWTEVAVSRDPDGLVRIDPTPPAAADPPGPAEAFIATIPVAGGVLTVDVRVPHAAPAALLDDPAAADAWLRAVYGPAVAAQVLRYADDPEYDASWTDFAQRDHLSEGVGALGEEFWLHRWWPADWYRLSELDEDLLEVEISGRAWAAEGLFEDPEPIRHLLTPHGILAAAQVQTLLDGPAEDVSGTELRVFAAALRAFVDLVSDDAPGYAECVELLEDPRLAELEAVPEASAIGGVPWLRTMADRVRELVAVSARGMAARGLAYEAPKGPGDDEDGEEDIPFTLGPVDWAQVPPRVVSMREPFANLAFRTVGTGDASVVEVVVPAAANYMPGRGDVLYARAYDRSEVPVTFPLEFRRENDDDPGEFVGSRQLFGAPDGDLLVDVFSPDFVRRPRLRGDASRAVAAEILARAAFLERRAARPSDELSLTEQVMRVAEQG